MNRNEEIMKAIREQNITPRIEAMMREDIQKGENTMDAIITRTCKEKDCKKTFTISAGEAKWLKDKNLELYKRCPDCRKKRRKEANGQ